MRNLRVAVLGAGRLGGFHAQKLAAREDVELVAVVDPVEEAARRTADACHTRALTDCRSVLDQIDAAVIAAPTRNHHELALELLKWGIHLLVEKPLCSSSKQADELVRASRRNGAVLQVGHVERFNSAFAAAAPHLVNPKYIETVRSGPFTFRSTDVGVVLDLMIHDIDLVLSLVRSPVRRVDAMGISVVGGHEDAANVRLEFQSGCVASLSASRVSHESVRHMQAWTPTGYVNIDFGSRKTTVVSPSETLLDRRYRLDTLSGEALEHARTHFMEEHLPRKELTAEAVDALALEQADFIDSIRGPRSPRVTGENGRDAVAIAERILAKIDAHAWDDQPNGLAGPLAIPRPSIIPAPHWKLAAGEAIPRKEAG